VDTIEDLMTSNLLRVFNERDDARRTEAIARTYTADVTWTDDEGSSPGTPHCRRRRRNCSPGFAALCSHPPARSTGRLDWVIWLSISARTARRRSLVASMWQSFATD